MMNLLKNPVRRPIAFGFDQRSNKWNGGGGSKARSPFKAFESTLKEFYGAIREQNWSACSSLAVSIQKVEVDNMSVEEVHCYNLMMIRFANALKTLPFKTT